MGLSFCWRTRCSIRNRICLPSWKSAFCSLSTQYLRQPKCHNRICSLWAMWAGRYTCFVWGSQAHSRCCCNQNWSWFWLQSYIQFLDLHWKIPWNDCCWSRCAWAQGFECRWVACWTEMMCLHTSLSSRAAQCWIKQSIRNSSPLHIGMWHLSSIHLAYFVAQMD